MEEPPLASLSLTHVHYNPNDPLSYLSAWLALVPQALCVTYVTLIWSTRELEILLMFAGQLCCEALNFLLKRWIREERPRQMYGKGYGMPSSHSQFVTFFSLSLGLFLIFRHVPHGTTHTHTHTHTSSSSPDPGLSKGQQRQQEQEQQPAATSSMNRFHLNSPSVDTNTGTSMTSFTERLALSILACLCAAVVAGSRVYLNYHTPRQVLAGCAAGAVFAVIWFLFTTYLRRSGWLDWGLDTWLAKLFRLRDLVVDEDLVDAGWERWEARRKLRMGMKSREVINGAAAVAAAEKKRR